jgi:hypothetical protein
MLMRFSAKPPGGEPDGTKQHARANSQVIERFFALLERLAPLPHMLETKSRPKPAQRAKRRKPRSKAPARSGTEKQS